MVFSLIRQTYRYANESGADQEAVIPTLHEWMDDFADNPDLEMIILDLKIAQVDLADFLVDHIFNKAYQLGVAGKLRLVSSDYSMAGALQSALARIDEDIGLVSRVFGGTTATVHIGYDSTENFDAISEAKKECYSMANLGQTVSSNGWREYQNIIVKMVAARDAEEAEGGNYIPVIGWRINSVALNHFTFC